MYQIDEQVFKNLLSKRFNDFVGILCERIEFLEKQNPSIHFFANQVKFDLKKDTYTAMREIQGQVDAFSKGVKITVDLIKPASN
jgi:hypothetical protein